VPKFMAIYTGTATAAEKAQATGTVDEAAGMKAWGAWMEKYASAIVDPGGPLGKTKKATPEGIADFTNTAAAYVIVEAASHEAAAEMFRDHAHFTHFPGEGVEVMEILAVPGM
jgi:hypothetical protein